MRGNPVYSTLAEISLIFGVVIISFVFSIAFKERIESNLVIGLLIGIFFVFLYTLFNLTEKENGGKREKHN